MNLVVVSNRVARAKANEPMTGGLAAALLPMVEKSGAIWVGSSGRVRDGALKDPFPRIESLGAGAIAMLDLPADHYGGYYEGFANSALWPALHSRPDLIRVSNDDYQSYREVNAFMARALLRFRRPDTAFWIQDYHFLALGAELRDLNVQQPIGFFLHTPWPVRAVICGVPNHRELIGAMLAYNLIGFQTDDDCENFADYLRGELGLEVEDGVLWASRAEGVVAADIADATPAAAVGIQRGDLLIAINDRPIQDPADVVEILHGAGRGETLRYTVLRLGSRDVIDVRVAPIPGGPGILYFLLAGVGTFTAKFDHMAELTGRTADQIIAAKKASQAAA